jgi:hypothetical protein
MRIRFLPRQAGSGSFTGPPVYCVDLFETVVEARIPGVPFVVSSEIVKLYGSASMARMFPTSTWNHSGTNTLPVSPAGAVLKSIFASSCLNTTNAASASRLALPVQFTLPSIVKATSPQSLVYGSVSLACRVAYAAAGSQCLVPLKSHYHWNQNVR